MLQLGNGMARLHNTRCCCELKWWLVRLRACLLVPAALGTNHYHTRSDVRAGQAGLHIPRRTSSTGMERLAALRRALSGRAAPPRANLAGLMVSTSGAAPGYPAANLAPRYLEMRCR